MNKHDVNIKKGKLINFQIGIIAVISFCYVMHEVSHYTTPTKKEIAIIEPEEAMGPVIVWEDPATVIETSTIKKTQSKPKEVKIEPTATPKAVDNDTKIEPTEEKPNSVEAKPNTPIVDKTSAPTKTSGTSKTKKSTGVANPNTVDMMPIYPGCHKFSTNNELAVCFQEKIQRMINKKFDRGIGEELGISGVQRISLYFEINEKGQVSNIRARSNYPEFIKEAKRVAGLLPIMEPARRSGQKVRMKYTVPIVFQVTN